MTSKLVAAEIEQCLKEMSSIKKDLKDIKQQYRLLYDHYNFAKNAILANGQYYSFVKKIKKDGRYKGVRYEITNLDGASATCTFWLPPSKMGVVIWLRELDENICINNGDNRETIEKLLSQENISENAIKATLINIVNNDLDIYNILFNSFFINDFNCKDFIMKVNK